MRRRAPAEDQLGVDELGQGVGELLAGQRRDRGEQLVAELAPDHRPDLGHLPDRRQPVEPGHQRVVQRRRDRQRRQRPGQGVAVALLLEQPGLEHGLGQLLDEQRHPVRLGHDLLQHLGRQRLAARHPLGHGRDLALVQPVEREQADVGEADPGRPELGPEGDQHEHPRARDAVDDQVEQLERGRVAPVHVLVQRQHRLPRREPLELREQRREGPLLAPLRAQRQRRVAAAGRDRQQVRQQGRHRPDIVGREREQRLELVELPLRRVVAREPRRPLEQVDDRVERAALVVGRAEVAERGEGLARPSRSRSARTRRDLPTPGSPHEQHHLALALLGLPPAVEQQAELVLAADQRRQARRLARLEAALRAAAAEHPPGPHGCGEALEAVDAEVGVLEQAAEQAPGGRVDDHAARLGQGLEAGGEVRGLADHRLLLRRTLADQVADHDQPGRDADPGLRAAGRRTASGRRRRAPPGGPRTPPARPRPRAPAASRSRPARRRP